MVGKEINQKMYLENFILNDTINNNLTVRSSRKRMEDTQDIRGKNVAKATQLSKPVEEDDSSTNQPLT